MHEQEQTWLNFLHTRHILPEWVPLAVPWAVVAVLFLGVLVALGTRRMQLIPQGLQSLLEYAVEGLTGLTEGILGKQGKDFAPFIGTLFVYIAVLNLLGLAPGMMSPTANPNTTIALALIVFAAVQYHGVKANGPLGYAKHFIGEPWWMFPLMLPLHIIGELARPLSLSMRLYGNIFAKEVILGVLVTLAIPLLFVIRIGQYHVGIPLPFQLPILVLGLLVSLIQAMIFAVLASVYLALALPPEEGH